MCSEFLYIGHRGTRISFDENTMKAFKKAIEFGANTIEFDVRRTKDNKIVIMHDNSLDRTTNGSGLINKFNFSEINKFKTKIHDCPIPLLSDVLLELKGETKFMIDLKEDNLINGILKIVRSYSMLEDCIFSGRDLISLQYFKKKYPKSRICYNITKGFGFDINEFIRLGEIKQLEFIPDLISLRSNLISEKFIDICHDNGIKPLAWDFISNKNPLLSVKSLIKLGINGILFDNYRNIIKIKKWIDSN